jgi:hypothetical protein
VLVDRPLAQGFYGQLSAGGRADVKRKSTTRQQLNFTGNGVFSQVVGSNLWINKVSKINILGWLGMPDLGFFHKPRTFT